MIKTGLAALAKQAQPAVPVAPKKNGTTNINLVCDETKFPKRPIPPEGIESLFPEKTPTKPIESRPEGIKEIPQGSPEPRVVPHVAGLASNGGNSTPGDQQSEQQRPNDQAKQGGATPQSSETLTAAEGYIRAGWHVFPGKRRDKKPKTGWSWTKEKLTVADAPKYFDKDQHNVMVALGKASDDLVDIDLDWIEATAAADLLMGDLPSFGRSGKLRSHRLAICGDIKTHKYLLPQTLANHPKVSGEHATCIAEIRGSGAYTVFPGSEHETGQRVEWTNAADDNIAAIQAIDAKTLITNMGLLAFVAFCMRFFPAVGARCDFMLAVAGALAHAGFDGDLIQQIVQRIGAFNNDDGDNGTWRVAADSVTDKVNEGKEVTGLPTLIKILGLDDDVLKWCRDLLGTTRDNVGGPVVPKDDHMGRSRIYRIEKRPNLCHYRDDFYDYESGHYAMVDDHTIEANLYSFLDKCGKEVLRGHRSIILPFEPDTKSIHETINALKAVGHVLPTIEQPYWLDGRMGPDPAQLICFPNGILNLSTNEFMSPDPMLFTPHGVALDYDPNAPKPVEWLKFLKQVFDGEQDQIDSLQEMFGYCVSSDVSQEKVFMLIGPKRSGKDTKRHTLQSLISPKAVCGPTLDSMGTNFGMSAFIGKQLAIVGDMRIGSKCDKDLLAENILKMSGRGLFTIDRKHKDHWTGPLPCKLLLISNEMPKIKDTSGALASRPIIFQTRVSFYGREDPHLFRDKIRPELPGILNWALEGLWRMHQRGSIAEPTCSIEAREELAREGSPIMAFVQECLTLDPGAIVNKDVMYSTYLDYADHNGLHRASKSWFFRDLETATAGKVKAERVQKDGERVHNIVGAKISNPPAKGQWNGDHGIVSQAPAMPTTLTAADVGKPTEIDAEIDAALDERIRALHATAQGEARDNDPKTLV
jgi:putative DNA primase/helicase